MEPIKNLGKNISEKLSAKLSSPLWLFVFIFILSAFFGSLFGFMASGISQKTLQKLTQKFPRIFSEEKDILPTKQKVIQEDSAVIDVVEKSAPAVVSIVISKDVSFAQNFFFDPFGFFEQNPDNQSGKTEKQKVGGGTGFLITGDGMIITNKHVVSDLQASYTVVTNDDKEYEAKVLARDPMNDIAVIKIEGADFPVLDLGDSDSLKIGQTVIAIGNSLGEFSNTVSRGIVSGLKRKLTASGGTLGSSENLTDIIQTDAAINPGNSGGPLLDISGQVIGVNVAMAQGAQNVGFALPANQIRKVIEQVKSTGKISAPFLGIRYVPVDKQMQQENSLPFNYGVLISRGEKITDFAVIPGSPADKAGLTENTIVLELDGIKLDEKNSLSELIAKKNAGDEITLKIWQKGNEKEIQVKLEERK